MLFKILFKQIPVLLFLMPLASYAFQGEADLNYLYIAEPREDIENSQVEFNLRLKHIKVPETEVSYKETYKNYAVTQGFNYAFDAGLYAVSFFDYQLTLPEAYVSYGYGSNLFVLGRKNPNTRLYIDEIWSLGVDQAFQRINPFQPEEQGRLAMSYVLKSESVVVEAFFSPFSIPDQGATYEYNENGLVRSDNPWAVLPPSSLAVEGTGDFNLNYEILNDSVPEVLTNLQYGLNFSVKSDYLKVDGFYYNKTAKQLGFEVDPLLDPDQVGEVNLEATPFFIREHIFGVQLKSRWMNGFEVTNGFYGLVVDSSDLDSEVEYQTELNDYFFITTGFHLTFDWVKLTLAHLYRRERSFELNEDVIYFQNNRFLHGNAVKLVLSDVSYKRWNFFTDILFASEEQGLNTIFALAYEVNQKFQITSQLNIIQDLNDENSFESALSESNFSRFSSLDNFRVGVNYVF